MNTKTKPISIKLKKSATSLLPIQGKKLDRGHTASKSKPEVTVKTPASSEGDRGGYNADADKVIATVGVVECGRGEFIEITVRSYGGGAAKVSMLKKSESFVSTKLGRLSTEAAVEVGRRLIEAAKIARAWNKERVDSARAESNGHGKKG